MKVLFSSFFGIENDISVAVCGSNLINYQVEMLKSLEVEEIIIAFDKQYQEYKDAEYIKWEEKLINIYKKYGGFIQISFILDTENLLGYKDSPIDKGPDIFLERNKYEILVNKTYKLELFSYSTNFNK